MARAAEGLDGVEIHGAVVGVAVIGRWDGSLVLGAAYSVYSARGIPVVNQTADVSGRVGGFHKLVELAKLLLLLGQTKTGLVAVLKSCGVKRQKARAGD